MDLGDASLDSVQVQTCQPMTPCSKTASRRGQVRHYGHVGRPGAAESDVENVLAGKVRPKEVFCALNEVVPPKDDGSAPAIPSSGLIAQRILSGKRRDDGSTEIREAGG